MTQHYFTSNPQSAHDERAIQVELAGVRADYARTRACFPATVLDFGSRLLIETVHPLLHGRVLDIGCGWGAIGVLLARLRPDAQITMADINERAVALAARNARQNGVSAETLVSDGYENIAPSFDAIVTNPPIRAGKQTVYRILDEAKTRLAPGGRLFLVIRKERGAPSAQTHLQGVSTAAWNCSRAKRDTGFWPANRNSLSKNPREYCKPSGVAG